MRMSKVPARIGSIDDIVRKRSAFTFLEMPELNYNFPNAYISRRELVRWLS